MNDPSVVEARVAALALAASVAWAQPIAQAEWLWLPDGETLGTEPLILRLARTEKPLECKATRLGPRISVMCIAITKEERLRALAWMNGRRRPLADRFGLPGDTIQVLVRVAGESFLAESPIIDAFFSDYWIAGDVAFRNPDAGAVALGASVVLTISSAQGSMTLEETDPPPSPPFRE